MFCINICNVFAACICLGLLFFSVFNVNVVVKSKRRKLNNQIYINIFSTPKGKYYKS